MIFKILFLFYSEVKWYLEQLLIHKVDIALMLMDKTIATDPDKPQGTPSTDAFNTNELVRPSSFCFKSLVFAIQIK